MSSKPKSILLLGATGYIGGSLLAALQRTYPLIKVIVIARPSSLLPPSPYAHSQPSLRDALIASGAAEVIPGSHSDVKLIEDVTKRVDVVINAADSDDLPLTEAIIRGMEKKIEESQKSQKGAAVDSGIQKPILIHTSGTGLLTDEPIGEFTPYAQKIWNDNSETDIGSIADNALHRNVDNAIFAAIQKGLINGYIIAPSCIYGTGDGPGRRISIQIPSLIRAAVRRRQTVMIGNGTNVWDSVHIDDLVELYLKIFELASRSEKEHDHQKSPYSRFYFGSAASHEWNSVIRKLAEILYGRGLVDNADVYSLKSADDEPQIAVTAHNSRSYAERSLILGWKPSKPLLIESLEGDVDETLMNLKPQSVQ